MIISDERHRQTALGALAYVLHLAKRELAAEQETHALGKIGERRIAARILKYRAAVRALSTEQAAVRTVAAE